MSLNKIIQAVITGFVLFFIAIPPVGAQVLTQAQQEARMREYFADIPAMIPIAKCESGIRQYRADGSVVADSTGKMVGMFQINVGDRETVRLYGSLDPYTLEGNLAIARLFYEKKGTVPWNSSKSCWQPLVMATPTPTPSPQITPSPVPPSTSSSGRSSSSGSSGSSLVNPNANTEARIRAYFADIPVMIEIAKCESTFTQYTRSGNVLYDRSQTYIGAFQIAQRIHEPTAKILGYDLATLEGNMGYARFLYAIEGTRPWLGCIPKSIPSPSPASRVHPTASPQISSTSSPQATPSQAPLPQGNITLNFHVGMAHPEVLYVQKLLNKLGFALATSGPGSIGNETMMYGARTRIAVQQFQCEKNIVCNGTEWTTGYGRIGPRTRAALNLAAQEI